MAKVYHGWVLDRPKGILGAVNQGVIAGASALGANTALGNGARDLLLGTPVVTAIPVDSILVANHVANGDVVLVLNDTSGNSWEYFRADGSAKLQVFNEAGSDLDLRAEGDNNANMIVLDAGLDSLALGRAVVTGAFLSLDGATVNRAPVTSVGLELHLPAATYTKPAAASATTAIVARMFMGIPTFVASTNTATYSDAATLYIAGAAAASTNVTITRAYSLFVDAGNTRLDGDLAIGTTATSGAAITLANTADRTLVTQVGAEVHMPAQTIVDEGVATTKAILAVVALRTPTISATNAITYTDGATLYIQAAPVAAANSTISTGYAIWVDGGNLRLDGDLFMDDGARDLRVKSATSAAFEVSDGSTKLLAFDTRTTTDGVVQTTLNPIAKTVAEATSAHIGLRVAAVTHILSRTSPSNVITSGHGVQVRVDAATLNATSNATTITTASTVYIEKLVTGANMTVTNSRIIDTDATAFLTAAGVWTDNCGRVSKTEIEVPSPFEAYALLDEVESVSYKRWGEGGHDGPRRFGVIAEDVPDFLADASRQGVAAQYMAGFSLAVQKDMKTKLESLEETVAKLQADMKRRKN